MSTKGCSRIFLFCLDLELLINLVSVSVLKPGRFLFWQINSMAVGACQSFQFLRQNTWFLKNKRALCRFLCVILHYLIN